MELMPNTETGYPHNYSGETAEMTFERPFLFTHSDHVREQFRAGTYKVPVEVANHFYARAHSTNPELVAPAPGTPGFAEFHRKALAERAENDFAAQRARTEANRSRERQRIENELKPKIAAEMRSQIESETRAKVENEMRSKIEAEMRAKMAAERSAEAPPKEATPKDAPKK